MSSQKSKPFLPWLPNVYNYKPDFHLQNVKVKIDDKIFC